MSTLSSVIDIVTGIAGCALIFSGLRGIINPAGMARTFGVVKVTRDMTVFYPGLAGRNLGMGIAVWWLKILGERRSLGVLVCCLLCNGFSDTYLLLTHHADVDNVPLHVFNTCVGAVVGPLLLSGY